MITVDPANLTAGATATVCIKNSSHGGTIVDVRIDNGEGQEQTLQVELDADGNGCAEWVVPPWPLANFNYGSCPEVTTLIAP